MAAAWRVEGMGLVETNSGVEVNNRPNTLTERRFRQRPAAAPFLPGRFGWLLGWLLWGHVALVGWGEVWGQAPRPSASMAAASNAGERLVPAPEFVNNPYFSAPDGVAPTPRRPASESGATRRLLPAAPSADPPVWRPSVLTDEDGAAAEPTVEYPLESWGNFPSQAGQHGSERYRQTAFAPGRPATRAGQLEQSYSQPYRSQMPSLKQARPGDPFYQPESDAAPAVTGDCGNAGLFGEGNCGEGPGKQAGGRRGQWFGRYETLLAWPYASNGHPGITTIAGSGLQVVEPFDSNLIWGNRGVVGWESQKGPGGQFQYTDVFAISQRLGQGVTGGLNVATGFLELPGIVGPLGIAAGPGQRLEATTREHLTSYRPTAFKRVYFPVSTITGGFGVDHTILRQSVNYSRFADLSTMAASETLDGRRRFSGIGPTFDIEYHRPIGHTQLAMLGGAQMGVLFGSDRWEVFQDGGMLYRQNSRRVVTNAVVRVGVEWSQAVGPRPDQRIFARFTIEGQNWLNMGNFSSSDSALGFLSGNIAIGAAF